MLILHLICSCS